MGESRACSELHRLVQEDGCRGGRAVRDAPVLQLLLCVWPGGHKEPESASAQCERKLAASHREVFCVPCEGLVTSRLMPLCCVFMQLWHPHPAVRGETADLFIWAADRLPPSRGEGDRHRERSCPASARADHAESLPHLPQALER